LQRSLARGPLALAQRRRVVGVGLPHATRAAAPLARPAEADQAPLG
jgi:hypothetical protein